MGEGKTLKYLTATVKIFFPDAEVCCKQCPLLHIYSNRNQCMKTGELIADVSRIGMWCPLEFEEGDQKI